MSKLEAHIALSNNRLKEYDGGKVYLKDGANFQIELFNGEDETFGASIELNGKSISNSKLVLNPGERIFLDRYLDDQVKFLFETYNVDGTNSQVREAIKNNGNVHIKFYKERDVVKNPQTDYPMWTTNISTNSSDYYIMGGITGSSGTFTNISTTGTTGGSLGVSSLCAGTTTGTTLDWTNSVMYNGGGNMLYDSISTPSRSATRRITKAPVEQKTETGRIGKGEVSDQRVANVQIYFEYLPEYHASLNLLPESQRSSYVSSEVKSYCTECGTRNRSKWKFCPNCGTRA